MYINIKRNRYRIDKLTIDDAKSLGMSEAEFNKLKGKPVKVTETSVKTEKTEVEKKTVKETKEADKKEKQGDK